MSLNGASSSGLFQIFSGSTEVGVITATNFFQPALNNWMSVCAVANSTGYMWLYSNGQLAGTVQSSAPIPTVYRVNNYLAKSNWAPPAGGDECERWGRVESRQLSEPSFVTQISTATSTTFACTPMR